MKGIFGKITHEVTSPTIHTVTPQPKVEAPVQTTNQAELEQKEQESDSTESIGLSGDECNESGEEESNDEQPNQSELE